MATYRDRLDDLDDEVKFRLIANELNGHFDNFDAIDYEYAGWDLFFPVIMIWSRTNEGHEFWDTLTESYKSKRYEQH